MKDDEYKEYIENKNVEDVMKEYSEQHDEWETLLEENSEGVKRFKHQNGRDFFCTQYNPKDKEYIIDKKILETLSGKSIEQQMEYYYVTESYNFYSTAYGEITNEDLREHSVKLCEYKRVKELLLKGDILIGAKIDAWEGEGILLPDKCVCTYYASDNDGSGTKDREDYAYLIFKDCSL